MLILNTVIILYIGSMHTALGQPPVDTFKIKPEKCYGTDELMERRCCIFPPFFNRLSARECGALFALVYTNDEFNVTGMRRDINNNCKYWRCVLKKYQLLNDEDQLILEKYYNHLDDWAHLNHEFGNVLTTTKVFCRNMYRYQMPLTACQFFNFQSCIRNYVNVDCPKVLQTKQCLEWKEFYEECKEFYI